MIRAITHAALRLDLWLQAKVGRPYRALLVTGLVIEIVRRLTEIPERIGSLHQLGPLVATLALESALLIHQTGELSQHAQARGSRGHGDPDPPPAAGIDRRRRF